MTIDPRCCDSGICLCILDAAGRCGCGQQWDGKKMCVPAFASQQDCEPQPAARGTAPQQVTQTSRTGPANGRPAPVPTPPTRQRQSTSLARRWLSLGFGVAALAALALPLPTRAAEVAEGDARAVHDVVEAQLASFTAGNAEGAFFHASAAIRAQFGDAANFMSMVRASYPMLLERTATSYFVPEWVDGAVLQKVQLRDRAGRNWVATYQLQRQGDARWRINGCAVQPDSGNSSI